MKRFSNLLFAAVVVLAIFLVEGCGSSRQLQSLSVSPTSVVAQNSQAQFTASGQFDRSPMTGPARAAWFEEPPIIDPPGNAFPLTLTDQPFTAKCLLQGSGPVTVTVTAVSPVDANAPADTSIPLTVFVALVKNHSTTPQGGFMAATAQMNCP